MEITWSIYGIEHAILFKHVLSSDKLSYFHIPKSCHGFDMFIENWLGFIGFYQLTGTTDSEKTNPSPQKKRGLAAPLNGRCWQEIRCSIISSLRTLHVGIEILRLLPWFWLEFLSVDFCRVKRNHAITDHFQIFQIIRAIQWIKLVDSPTRFSVIPRWPLKVLFNSLSFFWKRTAGTWDRLLARNGLIRP